MSHPFPGGQAGMQAQHAEYSSTTPQSRFGINGELAVGCWSGFYRARSVPPFHCGLVAGSRGVERAARAGSERVRWVERSWSVSRPARRRL